MDASELRLSHIGNPSILSGTDFERAYDKCLRNELLEASESHLLLTNAIVFLNSADSQLRSFAYHLLLVYSVSQDDYLPLTEYARSLDLTPILSALARRDQLTSNLSEALADLELAHHQNYVVTDAADRSTSRTRAQVAMRYGALRSPRVAVSAPTSYGKSELVADKVAALPNGKVVVLVPTRALLSQTRASLVADPRIVASRIPVITHHDSYANYDRFIAVLTQERLKRLLVRHRDLIIDLLVVDEAQKMLDDGGRGLELAEVLAICEKRNESLELLELTPGGATAAQLQLAVGEAEPLHAITVDERLKSERFVLARSGEPELVYDQYLGRFIESGRVTPDTPRGIVAELPGYRILAYVNSPPASQLLAAQIAGGVSSVVDPQLSRAASAVRDLVHPAYNLASAIESGVAYHHGGVPDSVRDFVEAVFRTSPRESRRVLVSTSTLLEGVNTPADALILFSGSRGKRNLSTADFRNLVGRAGRLNEAFAHESPNLSLLRPNIVLAPGHFPKRNWNARRFLEDRAFIATEVHAEVKNPLLRDGPSGDARQRAVDYLENLEPGTTGVRPSRTPATEIGQLCINHGVHDFDVYFYERLIDRKVSALVRTGGVSTVGEAVDAIFDVFMGGVEGLPDSLARVRDNLQARAFYRMFVDWRAQGMTLREMVARNLKHWSDHPNDLVFVGTQWGELAIGGGALLWVRMADKSQPERVTLAVAKVKAEQEFVENTLAKYLEILHELNVVTDDIYYQVRYGTSDVDAICLLRNGFSPDLTRVLLDRYREEFVILAGLNRVSIGIGLVRAMERNDENAVLVYEADTRRDDLT